METSAARESSPVIQPFFPLDVDDWRRSVDTYSAITDTRLRLVVAGNTSMLPEGDPIRHLAELNERPELQPECFAPEDQDRRDALAAGYRIGVCLSATAMRSHATARGIPMPAHTVDSGERYLAMPEPNRLQRLARRLLRPLVDIDRHIDDRELYGRLPQYIGSAEDAAQTPVFSENALWETLLRMGNMSKTWRGNRVSFAGHQEAYEYMLLGMGDALELHAMLNNELRAFVEERVQPQDGVFEPVIEYAADLLQPGSKPTRIIVEPHDLEDPALLREVLEVARSSERFSSYSATAYLAGDKRAYHINLQWGSQVMAGSRIETVGHFDGRYILTQPGATMELTLAMNRNEWQKYRLTRNDVLVMQRPDGSTYALYHPFQLPLADKDLPLEQKQTAIVEILGLCRNSRYIPLKERARLHHPGNEHVAELVEQVRQNQQRQRFGKVGRFVAANAELFRDFAPQILALYTPLGTAVTATAIKAGMEKWAAVATGVTSWWAIWGGAQWATARFFMPTPPLEAIPAEASDDLEATGEDPTQ